MFGAKLNKQPGPLNEEALQMLRDQGLKKYTNVVTSDDFLLGAALRLHLRQEEINPDLKLYAAYLEVSTRGLGTHYYIPTDFIKDYDAAAEMVVLAVSHAVVEDESWNRAPSFIAGHLSIIEALAE